MCVPTTAPFNGWQSQPGGNGIQDIIEARLAQVFGHAVRIHASGRTDAGVHARAQVFHFDAAWRHEPGTIAGGDAGDAATGDPDRECAARGADVSRAVFGNRENHAYHLHLGDADPFTRPYSWPIFKPLDVAAMEAVAAELRGRHDFKAFAAFNGVEMEDTVRDLRRLEIKRRARTSRSQPKRTGFSIRWCGASRVRWLRRRGEADAGADPGNPGLADADQCGADGAAAGAVFGKGVLPVSGLGELHCRASGMSRFPRFACSVAASSKAADFGISV